MQFKFFLGKLFLSIFLLFFFNSFSFSFSISHQYHSNIFFDKNIKNTFVFSKKKECFAFLKSTKPFFLKKEKIVIGNSNFIGFFKNNRFKMFYIVKSKDTLYSIGKKSGHDYHELSKFNFIKKPYKIVVGQKIWIGDFFINTNKHNCSIINLVNNSTKLQNSCEFIFKTPLSLLSFFNKNIKFNSKPTKICFFCNQTFKRERNFFQQKDSIFSNNWYWPIQSKHIQYFYESKLDGNTKIEIFGFKGQPVFAAASGEVVYITDLFEKYGRLIIIKHNKNYLSIYAFNDSILVKLREKVYAKQKIATMGLSPEKKLARLYFEIRYKGESVNPLNVLPIINK